MNDRNGACFASSRTIRSPARGAAQSLSVARKANAHGLAKKLEPATALRPQHHRAAGEAVGIGSGKGPEIRRRLQQSRYEQELTSGYAPASGLFRKAITPPGRSAEMPDPKEIDLSQIDGDAVEPQLDAKAGVECAV